VALATFAVFGWGVQLLWVHYSDPIVSVRIEHCRGVRKGTKCTGVWRSPDGSEKTVHIDDGGYYLRVETEDVYIHGDRAYRYWQTPAIHVFFFWVYWPGFDVFSVCHAVRRRPTVAIRRCCALNGLRTRSAGGEPPAI
jgi:hypothetical protein